MITDKTITLHRVPYGAEVLPETDMWLAFEDGRLEHWRGPYRWPITLGTPPTYTLENIKAPLPPQRLGSVIRNATVRNKRLAALGVEARTAARYIVRAADDGPPWRTDNGTWLWDEDIISFESEEVLRPDLPTELGSVVYNVTALTENKPGEQYTYPQAVLADTDHEPWYASSPTMYQWLNPSDILSFTLEP